MRNNVQNKRMRGRNRKSQNPLTRVFESNGPDVKVRGSATHIAEKYVQLARDSQSSGDFVSAENYYQHAEHYFRLIAAAQEQFRQTQPSNRQDGETRDDDDGGDDDQSDNSFGPREPYATSEPYQSHDQQQREQHQFSEREQQPREQRFGGRDSRNRDQQHYSSREQQPREHQSHGGRDQSYSQRDNQQGRDGHGRRDNYRDQQSNQGPRDQQSHQGPRDQQSHQGPRDSSGSLPREPQMSRPNSSPPINDADAVERLPAFITGGGAAPSEPVQAQNGFEREGDRFPLHRRRRRRPVGPHNEQGGQPIQADEGGDNRPSDLPGE